MGFWVETKTPKSWLIMTSSWWCTAKSVLNQSGTKRFADPGFLSHFNHCFALTLSQTDLLTKIDFCVMTSS